MVTSPPREPTDIFELAAQGFEGGSVSVPGYTNQSYSSSSSNTFQKYPNGRDAVQTRNMVQWFIPEVGIIEMYVNPQSITYNYKKNITSSRTKGGFVSQYWGEDLIPINISGTTGSSGIEGINVLENVYRSEQVAFDPYALALASDRDAENNDQFAFLGDFPTNSLGATLDGFGKSFLDLTTNAMETGAVASTRAQPTLASLAFSVEMYWSGWVYRGWFTDMRVEERAERLGLFDYQMTFMAVQKRGLRTNFLGWHRSATDGPSFSDSVNGRPHSYTNLYSEGGSPVPISRTQEGVSLIESLQDSVDFISSIF